MLTNKYINKSNAEHGAQNPVVIVLLLFEQSCITGDKRNKQARRQTFEMYNDKPLNLPQQQLYNKSLQLREAD